MNPIKLGFRNVKKNLKDYVIYYLTLTLSVSVFFSFNTAMSPQIFASLPVEMQNMSAGLRGLIELLSAVVAIVLVFLILYANQFLLKRRKKELGIYLLLGMNKSGISFIFFCESIIVGTASLLTGILVGILIAQVVSMFALSLFGGNLSNFRFVFSWSTLIITLLSFSAIYLTVICANIINVLRLQLIDLS